MTPPDEAVETHAENLDLLSFCGIFKPAVRGVKLEDMEEAIRDGHRTVGTPAKAEKPPLSSKNPR